MTFDQIVQDICGRLNLVSTEAVARVGQAVNRHYRRVTATIGLEPIRFVTRSAQTTLDSAEVTFADIEKIDRVFEKSPDGLVLVLQPVMLAQIREAREMQGTRQQYAILHQRASSITILLQGLALAITDLYADGWTTLAPLVGSEEPALPASFHDILIFSVVAEEQMRKEKPALADRFAKQADDLLRELRFHIADAPAVDLRQGDNVIDRAGGGGTGGSGSSVITGDIVFDRAPAPPFDVTAGSGMVTNLDADKLDGQHGTFYQNASNLIAGTVPPAQIGPDSVGFDKLANLAPNRLLGRGGAGATGDPEPIVVGSGLALIGTTLQAMAQAPIPHAPSHNAGGGDPITALSAAVLTSGTLDPARLAPGSVTNDKLVDLAASQLLGRSSGAPGDPEPITLGAGLTMAGSELSSVSGAHHQTHEPGGTDVLTLSQPSMLFGRGNAGAANGPVQEITLGPNLYMDGTTLRAKVSSSQLFNYDWSVTQTPPPTSSQLRTNAAHPYTLATELYVRPITSDGIDVYWSLMRIKGGTGLFVQDKNDHSAYFEVRTVGDPVDNGTHITFTTSPIGSGATALLNNQSVVLVIGSQPDAGVAPHAPTHARGASDPVDVTTLAGFTGVTTDFLRADGTFAVPAGGSGGGGSAPGGVTTSLQFNDAGVLGGDAALTFDKATKALQTADVHMENAWPQITLLHQPGPVDQRKFTLINDGANFYLISISDTGAEQVRTLTVARNGDVSIAGKAAVGGGEITLTPVSVGAPVCGLHPATAPGSDNSLIQITGGGDSGNSAQNRGGRIGAFGNQHSQAGEVFMLPGNVAGSQIKFYQRTGVLGAYMDGTTGVFVFTRPANKIGAGAAWDGPAQSLTWDLSTGAAFVEPVAGGFVAKWSNPPPTGVEFIFSLQLNCLVNGIVVTWPASVTWDEDVVPVMPNTGRSIILGFSTVDGGTRWRGYIGGRNFAT